MGDVFRGKVKKLKPFHNCFDLFSVALGKTKQPWKNMLTASYGNGVVLLKVLAHPQLVQD